MAAVASAFVLALRAGGGRPPNDSAQQLIAFARADGIYLIRADGSGLQALRRGGVASRAVDLACSPDGRRLAFATGDAIWRMDADGRNLLQLSSPARYVPADFLVSVSSSPDGRRLIYTAKSRDGNREIWVVNADGSKRRLLNAAYMEKMGAHRPARTVIGVRELPKPGVLLTMNLTAVTRG